MGENIEKATAAPGEKRSVKLPCDARKGKAHCVRERHVDDVHVFVWVSPK